MKTESKFLKSYLEYQPEHRLTPRTYLEYTVKWASKVLMKTHLDQLMASLSAGLRDGTIEPCETPFGASAYKWREIQ